MFCYPSDFLGRTEVRIKDVLDQSGLGRGPITKRLILHEVETGEVVVKLDLQLFEGGVASASENFQGGLISLPGNLI